MPIFLRDYARYSQINEHEIIIFAIIIFAVVGARSACYGKLAGIASWPNSRAD
jgi:hypothetical protein